MTYSSMLRRGLLTLLLPLLLAACAPGVRTGVAPNSSSHFVQTNSARSQGAELGLPEEGIASWYGPGFAGNLTANGEIFNPAAMTAAHKTLPFGTWVRVTNLNNGLSVVVRINDRGPFKPGRIIDLSRAAAERIGMIGSGTAPVRVELLESSSSPTWTAAATDALQGYDILSRFHQAGDLLYLDSATGGEPLLVRVVGSEIPGGVAADVMVSQELFALLGAEVFAAK